MKKLWDKGQEVLKEIIEYTTGMDPLLDLELVYYDCEASKSHARMLEKEKIISYEELKMLEEGLDEIQKLNVNKKFKILESQEDCHTAIEHFLTEKYGDVGKKIHTGRSRNDQVLTAIRLYEKDYILKTKSIIKNVQTTIENIVKRVGLIIIPGYTHSQKAMPASVKMLFGSYLASFQDDLNMLDSVFKIIDQSPLGSAAGFGIPILNIDREFTAKDMKFNKVMENPMYCQMSRGKFEANIIGALKNVMFTLNKMSSDLILFSMDEFKFITLSSAVCTGSSIMPQKKNPDPLEIIRANYSVILGEELKVNSIISNLMSGYHRDFQLIKESVFKSFNIIISSLKVMDLILNNFEFNKENISKQLTSELYAVEEANKLVKAGIPFRDAYKKVGEKFK